MNTSARFPGLSLGIIGGGQLGRMMAIEARRMGIRVLCLDPSPQPPALGVAHTCFQGDLYDPASIRKLAQESDVLTFEIEHLNTQVLEDLETQGVRVYPSSKTLKIIQDKYHQKHTLAEAGLPVPSYALTTVGSDGLPSDPRELGFSYPVVQKTRTGGYDGRGVKVWNGPADRQQGLRGPSFFEEAIPFRKELAVLLARDAKGAVKTWPVIEMVFDPKTQICNQVCAPARISSLARDRALDLGQKAVQALDGVGVFGVELFLTDDDGILINEVAPRPHNSGHWTIEGSLTSQFNQHIRAVCGLPLGSTELTMPSVTVNLLGSPGAEGSSVIQGYSNALAIPGLAMHWYEKEQVSTQRKMGHITIVRPTLDEALALAQEAQSLLRVDGREQKISHSE